MTYLRPYNQKKGVKTRTITIVSVVVLVVLVQLVFPHVFTSIFTSVAMPFWKLEVSLESGVLKSPASLLRENQDLKFRLDELMLRNSSSTLSLLEARNNELMSLFGRTSTSTHDNLILAVVLARPGLLPYDEFIVDLGSNDGVSTSSLVYAPGRVLIGHIVEVNAGTSKVILFSSPKETFEVGIGPSHTIATAMGRGGGQYSADVPHGSDITVGDVVSDYNIHDRAFGEVIAIEADPSNPFDKVLFAPPINIFESNFVLVDVRKSSTNHF